MHEERPKEATTNSNRDNICQRFSSCPNLQFHKQQRSIFTASASFFLGSDFFPKITHDPLLKVSENCLILSMTAQTSGTTLTPSLLMTASLGALRATWSTDLFSVVFI
jgi:hypothetical protein